MTITAEFAGAQFEVSSVDGVALEDVQEIGRVKRVAFAGPTVTIPAVAGATIRVLAFSVESWDSPTPQYVKFRSGITDLSGNMLITNGKLSLPFGGAAWFETPAGGALNVDGGMSAYRGFIIYAQD